MYFLSRLYRAVFLMRTLCILDPLLFTLEVIHLRE